MTSDSTKYLQITGDECHVFVVWFFFGQILIFKILMLNLGHVYEISSGLLS